MEKEYISARQCIFLLIGSIIGISLMLVPSLTIVIAKQDAWLAPWLSTIPGLVLISLLVSLNKMYPGQSLVQYSSSILGLPGYFLSLLMLWFFLFLGALNLRSMVHFLTSIILFETPPSILYFFIILLCAYGIKLGLEVMARAFSLLIPFTIILALIIQVFSMINADFEKLLPILSNGVLPVIHAGLNFTAFPVGEALVLFSMIIYQVKNLRGIGAKLSSGFIFAIFILFLVIERAIVTLGPERASRSIYSIAAAINTVSGGGIILPFLTLNGFVFSVSELILCYYAFVTGVAHWAKLSDYKPLILPAGALFMVLGIYSFENAIEEATFSSIWTVYALPIEFGIPLLLWVAAVIKSRLKPTNQL
ncbi:GerAB/ArcD/ProY family transporter [Desulforamulus aeronauticus]|uniref:Spore germination protein KB n=1 Tax=Desulforamulus aeronauticus DSM 10349 TaxID=1121421 RepID=A0A1M6RMD9_9FIRM|nr:GerAB/ArcD/ProY family transporter [Desulforamulus aeronauticus]SHK33681.1 spore germination protein KB [Desulforamulus aeronauticus DSM 10349]